MKNLGLSDTIESRGFLKRSEKRISKLVNDGAKYKEGLYVPEVF